MEIMSRWTFCTTSDGMTSLNLIKDAPWMDILTFLECNACDALWFLDSHMSLRYTIIKTSDRRSLGISCLMFVRWRTARTNNDIKSRRHPEKLT